MSARTTRALSGALSQYLVVCLLSLFIVVALIGMFSTAWESRETTWIGMTVEPLGGDAAAALGIPGNMGGVIVAEVDGIARKAGIRHGDVVVGINGEPVRDMADFSALSGETDLSKGGTQLDIIRRGARMPVFVRPGAEPALSPLPAPRAGIVDPPVTMGRQGLGIDAETFTAGEGRDLGIPTGVGGVLVDGVARGSLAERTGLAVNDVIVSVNGQRTDAAADLWSALAGLDGADRIDLGVYRKGQLMSVAVPTATGTLAGGFPGRMGGWGMGPGGLLICPNCGTSLTHQRGFACFSVACPSCGASMVRAQ